MLPTQLTEKSSAGKVNTMSNTKKTPPAELPVWDIPVTWTMEGILRISAPTLQEALNLTHKIDEPLSNGDYVLGSFEPSIPYTETVRRMYNHDRPDMVKLGD